MEKSGYRVYEAAKKLLFLLLIILIKLSGTTKSAPPMLHRFTSSTYTNYRVVTIKEVGTLGRHNSTPLTKLSKKAQKLLTIIFKNDILVLFLKEEFCHAQNLYLRLKKKHQDMCKKGVR